MFEQILIAIVLSAISYLLMPRPNIEAPRPHSLKDFDVPSVDPSKEIVVFWGTGWLKDPNIVWYGDLGTTPITTDSSKK